MIYSRFSDLVSSLSSGVVHSVTCISPSPSIIGRVTAILSFLLHAKLIFAQLQNVESLTILRRLRLSYYAETLVGG